MEPIECEIVLTDNELETFAFRNETSEQSDDRYESQM